MNISVRQSTESDLKTVQDLNHKLFLWDYDRDPVLNTQWPYEEAGEEYFRKRISAEQGVCFVAEDNDRIIGYVVGRVNNEIDTTETVLRCELENIFVESNVRNNGAGRLLVHEFISWCKARGAESMLVTAYFTNENAIEFYKTCGFNPFALKLERKL